MIEMTRGAVHIKEMRWMVLAAIALGFTNGPAHSTHPLPTLRTGVHMLRVSLLCLAACVVSDAQRDTLDV